MAQSAYATRSTGDDRSMQELWADMAKGASTLIRQEVELAKIETKEQLSRAGKAGAVFSAAGVAGFMALQLLSFAAAWGLAAVVPDGLAFLIVGVIYAIVAAVLLSKGRKQVAEVNLVPQQTVETLREDVEWAKAQRR
ncbi:MAG: phage holin family protein [Actinobacteria bacterium]|nr:phage holin family protein [Actinomycetota bacterium]MBW3642413.1 phage holin family protein [Actinomycetota bacterium]